MKNINKTIGALCREHRTNYLHMTQKEVGECVGYSKENISIFERGLNDNATILCWYMANGVLITTPLLDILRINYALNEKSFEFNSSTDKQDESSRVS